MLLLLIFVAGTILFMLCSVFVPQVGLELISRDYDMESPYPFRKDDIISMVPMCKVGLSLSLSPSLVLLLIQCLPSLGESYHLFDYSVFHAMLII